MKKCQECERLKQRVAELNSELLVLKIAAFAAAIPVANVELPKTRRSSARKAAQVQAG